jgi:hypothetical protein
VPQPGDLVGDLVAGDLAALAGLGALGHLDLQHVGVGEVLRGDPEAARGDLLDAAVEVEALCPGAEPAGSSPPSPELALPPIRFSPAASVSCASADSAPCDIAPVENRAVIASTGSTSSSGIGSPAADRRRKSRG